jgi:hypothetical protein
LDDAFKAQIRFSLEVLASTLNFITSPYVVEHVRSLCTDRSIADAVRRVAAAAEALERECWGGSRADMVARMIEELMRCETLSCVRTVVEEYREILGIRR